MASFPIDRPWEIVASSRVWRILEAHLYPGDGDEYAAVLLAGVHVRRDRVRLLVREVFPAAEGVDHVPGKYGYKMIRAQFIQPLLRKARDEKLVYLSVHNHAGVGRVAFSDDDLASHERGYPALLDIVDGLPVGALVFARGAVAGDIWLPDGHRVPIERGVLLSARRQIVRPEPLPQAVCEHEELYDRQVRLFGQAGQRILQDAKVGIVGLGGAGSQLAEILGRLGVGRFVLIDPDRADRSNLPRLMGARPSDVLVSETQADRLAWLGGWVHRLRRRKIDLAARNIRRANRGAQIERVFGSVIDEACANRLLDCDFIFLAADQMSARLAINAIVHQYFIPAVQVGAKVVADAGEVQMVFAVSRPVTPDGGCLWCNGLIDAAKLQQEATEPDQARVQDYGTQTAAPSVASLNALATADAVNLFQFFMTGLADDHPILPYRRYRPLQGDMVLETPRASDRCTECGLDARSRLARGDAVRLPLKRS